MIISANLQNYLRIAISGKNNFDRVCIFTPKVFQNQQHHKYIFLESFPFSKAKQLISHNLRISIPAKSCPKQTFQNKFHYFL
jgi:hypothetical protein